MSFSTTGHVIELSFQSALCPFCPHSLEADSPKLLVMIDIYDKQTQLGSNSLFAHNQW